MNWIDLPKKDREKAIEAICYAVEKANLLGPAQDLVEKALGFLRASNEEPFAEQIRTEMAGLRKLYTTWQAEKTEAAWRAALSACVTLHYLIRRTHPDRPEFEAIRQTLVDEKPHAQTMGGSMANDIVTAAARDGKGTVR